MVGYSSRLALSTTFTGLLFGVTTRGAVDLVGGARGAVPALVRLKLLRTSNRWADPVDRSRVIATVAS